MFSSSNNTNTNWSEVHHHRIRLSSLNTALDVQPELRPGRDNALMLVVVIMALGPVAQAIGLLLVLPSRAYRRSFPGDFGEAAGIPTATARSRFDKKGCKWSQSIEEVAAVVLRCLGAQTDRWGRRYRRRKVRRQTARERLGAEGSWYPRRESHDKNYT